ncbi:MAG TPA: hypothetical protein VF833_01785, partial [Gaiellaceae bacterium]
DVEDDPFLVAVVGNRFEREVPWDLSLKPGPATGRSGAYPDRTPTGWPDAASKAQHGFSLVQ